MPADKKLYALRDVTGTVESRPLIAVSIMSKKIATGAKAILLDIKVGDGAFMKDIPSGMKLAQLMIAIGKHLNRKVWAHLTNMDQPLGRTIGNAIEVMEAVKAVRGEFIAGDFQKIIYDSAADLLLMANKAKSKPAALKLVKQAISSGAADAKLKAWISAQGGDTRQLDDFALLFNPKHQVEVRSKQDGYVFLTTALGLGMLSVELGAGREKKGDAVDSQAGIYLHKTTGEKVTKGELLATLYSSKPIAKALVDKYNECVRVQKNPVKQPVLIYKRITS